MMMVLNLTGAAVLALGLAAGGAQAATLSFSGTGTSGVLPTTYEVEGAGLPADGDAVTIFESAADGGLTNGGLTVSGPAKVTFTYLGKEAGYQNRIRELALGTEVLDTAAVGSSTSSVQGAGFVDFLFRTLGEGDKSIINGGISDLSKLGIAFSNVFNGGRSVFAFFDDGGANDDADYDDMVVRIDVAAVPVPAAGLLLLSGLGGIAALRRRKAA